MIPIKYRLDSITEKEYIDMALSCINNAKNYSHKLEVFLNNIKHSEPVAGNILNRAKRFTADYPDSWCLCEWLGMPYAEMAEIRNYLDKLICADLGPINAYKENKKYRIEEIKSYHDLQSRRKKTYSVHTDIEKIVSKHIWYDDIDADFEAFRAFYDDWPKGGINYWIIEKTEIKVCPYCNISYTYSRGKTVTAQLDHFFPKSEYAILALCFYNLIPSCPACNKIKLDGTKEMASPYKDGAFKDLRITWDYAAHDKYSEKGSLTELEEMIEIKIETDSKDEQCNLTDMKIEEAYQQHRDYASEIIKKARTYANPEAQKLICNIGTSVGITPEEVERFYLGNYMDENDLKKRPLSKMTKDFYCEIIACLKADSGLMDKADDK